ncbi:MAG: 16S rRNA processing protein RimM [Myxococcales bacterium]|nr:16S rRNA processing protein RimM [Myxococcales bacterium]
MRGDPRLEIGGIARAHGIKGEVVVHTHDPDSEILGELESIYVGGVEKKIVEARPSQKGWLVLFEGITTRTEAEHLRGQVVEVDRELLELADGEVLLDDLVGCKVVTIDGTPWGTVAGIELSPAQEILVIHDGEVERMLPLVDQFVTNIDIAAGVVTVDPPEGLPESKVTVRS